MMFNSVLAKYSGWSSILLTYFFAAFINKICNYRDSTGVVPAPQKMILCIYTLTMLESDSLSLWVLRCLFIELAKLVENFAVIIQSGQLAIITNDTVF